MSDDEALDAITDALSLECWFEGKTLTVMVSSEPLALAKLRFVGLTSKPSAADLRGEPA